MKTLAVFDFDHTILDDNSDTVMVDIIGKDNIPQDIKDLQYREGWTSFMQGIFKLLYENGITQEDITANIQTLPLVEGMLNLINELKEMDADIVILSDSNTYFIKVFLEKHNLENKILKVFTNPAKFVDGMLTIVPYHHQTNCKLSTKNLCKGQILEEFLAEQKTNNVIYGKIIYVGDGVNDFCPALHLNTPDLICARNNYKLQELVLKAQAGKSFDNKGTLHHVKADLFIWESGHDILANIKK